MSDGGNTWLSLPRYSYEYTKGVTNFVKKSVANFGVENEIKCPCRRFVTLENMDPDSFSYSVLIEWVKELKYDEIGGIYVQNEDNDGWTLMTDDRSLFKHMYATARSEIDYFIDCDVDKGTTPTKQMQPHVIVRPRSSLFKAKDKNAEKRKYVTLKNINDEKKRKMSLRKKLKFGNTTASPTKEGTTLLAATEEEETDDSGKKVGLSEYLQKFEVAGGATVPLGEKLKNIKSKAPGSMAAYLELRELQKTQS
ncbi:hypothetical protein POM88_012600 [Heracleum sosnowskyi]|uniref:Transposase-associated domain-containing protein n=1 Tax=Heracleum sosnowskyi TaxID=360622 RepID=A0AAD8N1V5_9APIA|nr:hypothetical protein POM88_012600 [Heracleum sosnowskyi]